MQELTEELLQKTNSNNKFDLSDKFDVWFIIKNTRDAMIINQSPHGKSGSRKYEFGREVWDAVDEINKIFYSGCLVSNLCDSGMVHCDSCTRNPHLLYLTKENRKHFVDYFCNEEIVLPCK